LPRGGPRASSATAGIVGRRFRLAHVFFRGGKVIETSTFRANVTAPESEEDADLLIRHDNVFGSEEEDALRRDFTINGLFYDPNSGRIIDHVGGLDDLRLRRVRMIGNPDIRLREDPVRILRAVRIAAKTNLSIDPELLAAMERHRGELPRCSPARLFEERMRLFRSGSGEKGLRLLEQTAVLAAVLPLVASYLALARATGRHEDAELLFGHIAALDALARRGEVSDVLIIAALLHAPVAQHVAAQQAPDLHAALIDELVLQATELGATRKMTERLRQVLLAQRHLERPSGRRKTRRVPPEALMRRVYFAEALDFFEIVGRATQREEHLDELAMWRDRPAVEADGGDDEGEEPSPHAGATPTSGRRRRRRRGGRGEGRSGADATPAS
jgi:poly(A) polymerase